MVVYVLKALHETLTEKPDAPKDPGQPFALPMNDDEDQRAQETLVEGLLRNQVPAEDKEHMMNTNVESPILDYLLDAPGDGGRAPTDKDGIRVVEMHPHVN